MWLTVNETKFTSDLDASAFFLIYGLRWINWVYTFAQITFFFQTEKGVEKVIDKDTKE